MKRFLASTKKFGGHFSELAALGRHSSLSPMRETYDLDDFIGHHEDTTVAWILGNGPSVRVSDLEQLGDQVSFGANRVYLAYDSMVFRPTYLCSADETMIEDHGQEMVSLHPGHVFLTSDKRPNISGENWSHISKRSTTPIKFSEDIRVFAMPGGGSLITALQIGYSMGIRKFFLYGIDHEFTYESREGSDRRRDAYGDDNHFIADYRGGRAWQSPVLWQAEAAFLSSASFLEARGGWIRNATRGGKLKSLPRVTFEEALKFSQLARISDWKTE